MRDVLPLARMKSAGYGRAYGDRHSPLKQITPQNVSKLEVAWRFHTGEGAPEFKTRAPTALEVTPLVFRGTMYLSTPLGRVFAVDPTSGNRRWVYDPQVDRNIYFGISPIAAGAWLDQWQGRSRSRIQCLYRDNRHKADCARPATGTPCSDFGPPGLSICGRVAECAANAGEYEETSPPTVGGCRSVGSAAATPSHRCPIGESRVRRPHRSAARTWPRFPDATIPTLAHVVVQTRIERARPTPGPSFRRPPHVVSSRPSPIVRLLGGEAKGTS